MGETGLKKTVKGNTKRMRKGGTAQKKQKYHHPVYTKLVRGKGNNSSLLVPTFRCLVSKVS